MIICLPKYRVNDYLFPKIWRKLLFIPQNTEKLLFIPQNAEQMIFCAQKVLQMQIWQPNFLLREFCTKCLVYFCNSQRNDIFNLGTKKEFN